MASLRVHFSLALACGAWACADATPPAPSEPAWKPGQVYASPSGPNARGFLERRGLIHAHSHFSHDACDGEPVKDGVRDPVCLQDFRRGLCETFHDFVMLSDHDDAFSQYEFPQVLLHDAARGDRLLTRGDAPVGSWLACGDGRAPLVLAGMEADLMPVGFERHPSPAGERGWYRGTDAETRRRFHDAGALVLAQHTEDWTVDFLASEGVDGFEMYNLHANALRGAGPALQLLLMLAENQPGIPTSDVVLLPLWSEDPRYIQRWGSVLARGVRRVTTMGTDCHRNTFKALMPDGERVDSYRRMMSWLANHVLVRPAADGSWDDRALKEAIAAGRLYGVLETAGTPVGFDFRADAEGGVTEMGDGVALAKKPKLVATMPKLRALDPAGPQPVLTLRLLKARVGGFDVVAETQGASLEHVVTSTGAYRAEVRMVPRHLEGHLGVFEPELMQRDVAWVYANAIYVE